MSQVVRDDMALAQSRTLARTASGAELEALRNSFSLPLDWEISYAVKLLRDSDVETFESCGGGKGHSFQEPTIRFFGDRGEGLRATSIMLRYGLPISAVRRYWSIVNGEPTGPHWEITFFPRERLIEIQRQVEENRPVKT